MNILVLSAGTRNKIIEYYKEALARRAKALGEEPGLVIAADCSAYAPALYAADVAEILPRLDDPAYAAAVMELVKKHRVRGLFSLIDPELSFVAAHREELEVLGCSPMISPYELVECAFHKARMAECFAAHGLRSVKGFSSVEEFAAAKEKKEIDFPVFLKPENGSASIGIQCVETMEELAVMAARLPAPLIQEKMTGQEYGADAYVDMLSGRCVSIFLKKKLKMRAGETDKAVSVKDEEAFRAIALFLETAGFRGQVDIDLFREEDGGASPWVFSEVNPRYGGGYPHAQLCGLDMPSLYLHNLAGEENPVRIGEYETGIVMMKYNEVLSCKEVDA